MRVVAAGRGPGTTGSTTLTRTLQELRPGAPDLVDALFVLVLTATALLAWDSTFATRTYLVVGVAAALLGVLVAHVSTRLRWHWLVAVGVLGLVHLLLGSAVGLREDTVAGVVPTPASLGGLVRMTVGGWKDLLTTLPPVPGDGAFLVLPWLVGLTFGGVAFLLARRVRTPWLPPALGLLVVATTILLGAFEGDLLVPVAVLTTVASFLWLFVRSVRRRALAGTSINRGTRWVAAGLLLALATAGGVGAAMLMPGGEWVQRTVLRTYVQPPVQVDRYPSPLAGFRKYSSDTQALYDQALLRVQGAAPGTLVRMAVLDDYNGTAWSASGGMTGDPRQGFQRVGERIPGTPPGNTARVRFTVQPAYASVRELAPWVPALGPATDLTFGGARARDHAEVVRYNLGTGQGLVPDFLRADDTLEVASVALPVRSMEPGSGTLPQPEGPVIVPDQVTAPLGPALDRLAAAAGDPWSRATEIARAMREGGSWSNGTKPGQQQYLPGHGLGRLQVFAQELVGSDEHYAATYALALNRLGYPARVVMGGTVSSDGVVRGQDVRAWVEVSLRDTGWSTIPTEAFMPDRSKEPTQIPPKSREQQNAQDVPPANPSRPPGSFDSLFNTSGVGDPLERPQTPFDWWGVVVAVLRVVLPPLVVVGVVVGVLLGAKALRRRGRRTRGAPAGQVEGGWREFLDRARDLGRPVPVGATRLEQAASTGVPQAADLARAADRAVFGVLDPDADVARSYWGAVMQAHRVVVAGLPWWRRWGVALNPRSLVPPRAGRTTVLSGSRARRASPPRSRGR